MSGPQAPHILLLLPLVRGKPRQDELHIPSCPCLPRKRNLKPVAEEWNQIPQGRGGDVRSLVVCKTGAKPAAPSAGKTSTDMQIMPSTIPALWGPWKVELRICKDLWSTVTALPSGAVCSPQASWIRLTSWLPRLLWDEWAAISYGENSEWDSKIISLQWSQYCFFFFFVSIIRVNFMLVLAHKYLYSLAVSVAPRA